MQFLQQLQWDQNNSWLLFISLHSLLYCTKLIWNEVQWGVTSTLCASYIQTHQLHFNVFDIFISLSVHVFIRASTSLVCTRSLTPDGWRRWYGLQGVKWITYCSVASTFPSHSLAAVTPERAATFRKAARHILHENQQKRHCRGARDKSMTRKIT